MFPNATSPCEDIFHGLKSVTDGTAAGSHPLNASFCQGLRNCFLKWDESSLDEALDMYMKDENGGKGLVREVAKNNMLNTHWYTEGVMNYVEDNREEAEKEAKAFYEMIAAQDEQLADAAKQGGKNYQRFLKKRVQGVQRGTKAHLENFLVHYQKGCFKDPLPIKQMNVPFKEECNNASLKSPPRLICLCGTNICEITNKYFNWIGEHVTRQGLDVTYMKALLFIF
jgi:hypothetical protein